MRKQSREGCRCLRRIQEPQTGSPTDVLFKTIFLPVLNYQLLIVKNEGVLYQNPEFCFLWEWEDLAAWGPTAWAK